MKGVGTWSRARVAAPSQILSDCVYMWERTVMGISVHTAETETAKTPTTYPYPTYGGVGTASGGLQGARRLAYDPVVIG